VVVQESMGFWGALIGLISVTVVIAYFSDFLVGSVDAMADQYNISKVFIGVILLPIVGNATEHATAVTVALKNRMELAMGVCVGSATQVCEEPGPSCSLVTQFSIAW
jgi:Ca2+:H+ antiporter